MEIKRVVTAVDADGKSVFQEERVLPPTTAAMFPGTDVWVLWGTEGELRVPAPLGHEGATRTFFPGPGGTRFGVFTFPAQERDAPPPEMPPDEETLARLAGEVEEKLPGLLGVFEPDAPGMHATKTVDYCVVLRGTLTLELDDGVEAELPPGSCVVQNGTRHGWRNYGTQTAVLAFVVVGARGAS